MLHSCCAQRSSRHKNCRIGGLMLDCKFNSKQSSTRDSAKKILHLFKHLSLEKGFYQQTSLIVMYYITSLAKFGNCCSIVWVHRQGQWKVSILVSPFLEEVEQKLCIVTVLQCRFRRDFLSPRTTIASGVENYPSPSMSCCFDDLAQVLPCLDL